MDRRDNPQDSDEDEQIRQVNSQQQLPIREISEVFAAANSQELPDYVKADSESIVSQQKLILEICVSAKHEK